MFGDNVTLVSNIDLPKRKLAFNLQHATKAMCEQMWRRAPLQLRSDMRKMITLGLLFLTIMENIGHQWSKHPNTTPPCRHPSHTKARCESAQLVEWLYFQVWLRCSAWCRCRLSSDALCRVLGWSLKGQSLFHFSHPWAPGLLDFTQILKKRCLPQAVFAVKSRQKPPQCTPRCMRNAVQLPSSMHQTPAQNGGKNLLLLNVKRAQM